MRDFIVRRVRAASQAGAASQRGAASQPGLSPHRRRLRSGFSAAELMVVIAIIGIMVLVTTPAMMNFFNSMKVRTAAHRLLSHIRLCRQVAVSQRTHVLMELQRTTATAQPYYQAWEERNNNLVRNPNGVDNTVNTADDERWVVRKESTLAREGVKFTDSYDDVTPEVPMDGPGNSVMNSSGIMRLKFYPNGQILRMNDANAEQTGDTTIRMRLRRKVTSNRVDNWDVTLNRVGKVRAEFSRDSPPE